MRFINRKIGKNTISAKVEGSGPPILCLSGFGCDHYNFEYLSDLLKNNFTMILLDNRGMGVSTCIEKKYSLYDVAKDAHEFMTQLGYETYNLLGISMGGMIAQCLNELYPRSITKLGLLCTTSNHSEFIPLPETDLESLKQLYSLPKELSSQIVLKATTHPNIFEKDKPKFEKILNLRISHPTDTQEILKQKIAVDDFFTKKLDYKKLTSPTLILTGAEDRYVNPKNAQLLNQKINGSKLVLIPESDHYFFLEKPDLVAKEIRSFILEAN